MIRNIIRWILGTPWAQIVCTHEFGSPKGFSIGSVRVDYKECCFCARKEVV